MESSTLTEEQTQSASCDNTRSSVSSTHSTLPTQKVIHDSKQGRQCWKCRGEGVLVKKRESKSCTVCQGSGEIKRVRKRKLSQDQRMQTNPKKHAHYEAPGPSPVGDQTVLTDSELYPEEEEEICYLVGKWRIYQHTTAHRYSTDDVVTAWVAWREAVRRGYANPTLPYRTEKGHINAEEPFEAKTKEKTDVELKSCNYLDMGCGIGSVLLMLAWAVPKASCLGIEAQEERKRLAEKSIKYNGCSDRVKAQLGSLQELAESHEHSQFDLITGTPPYFPSGQGAMPACQESAGCLFELRGGIEDYANAAATLLKPEGCFVVVNTSLAFDRTDCALKSAGLKVERVVDAIPKEGKSPLFSIFVATKPRTNDVTTSEDSIVKESITIRDKDGNRTLLYKELLDHLGKPG